MRRPTCPTCEKPVDMENNPNRPFCCERCQLIDLGRWFGENYSLPHEGNEEGVEENSASESGDFDPDEA